MSATTTPRLWHRFPKWLVDERYEITYSPALAEPFGVVLFDRVSGRFHGCGHSIGAAAKAALKKRETRSGIRETRSEIIPQPESRTPHPAS